MSHRNVRLTPHGRLLPCQRIELHGWKLCEAAAAAGVSRQTAGKWLARWRAEGAAGLLDRSSRPCSCSRASSASRSGSEADRIGAVPVGMTTIPYGTVNLHRS